MNAINHIALTESTVKRIINALKTKAMVLQNVEGKTEHYELLLEDILMFNGMLEVMTNRGGYNE